MTDKTRGHLSSSRSSSNMSSNIPGFGTVASIKSVVLSTNGSSRASSDSTTLQDLPHRFPASIYGDSEGETGHEGHGKKVDDASSERMIMKQTQSVEALWSSYV